MKLTFTVHERPCDLCVQGDPFGTSVKPDETVKRCVSYFRDGEQVLTLCEEHLRGPLTYLTERLDEKEWRG